MKQRVAREGQGRSGGYRTILAFRRGARIVFLHGFAKNDQANLSNLELRDLKKAATLFLSWTEIEIDSLVDGKKWREVHCNGSILH